MTFDPITSWQIDGETVETVTDFTNLGSKITVDGDCSSEIRRCLLCGRGFPGGSALKNLPAVQELQGTWVWSQGQEDPLEEGMTTHPTIHAWRISWTEEPGGLQSIGSQSQTWLKQLSTHTHTHTHAPWKKSYDKTCQCIKTQRHHFPDKGP